MKKLLILSLTIVLVLTGSTLYGQSQILDVLSSSPDYISYKSSIDSSFEKCNRTWTTNLELGQCLGDHQTMWENQMLQFYDSLLIELDSTGKKLMEVSQKNWSNHIQSQRNFWSYFEDTSNWFGREGHFKAYYYDLNEKRNRTLELQAYLKIIREMKDDKK